MKKPKRRTRSYYDFNQCTAFIENKYKIDTRDYLSSHKDFGRWCKLKKEKQTKCPANCSDKDIKKNQEQFARYRHDVLQGKFKDKPYQDFWHWLTDVAGISRGGTVMLDESLLEGAEPWQQHILGLYLKEFGEGPYLTDW